MPPNKLGWNGLLGISSSGMALTTVGPIECDLLGTHLDPHTPYTNLHCRTQPSGFYLVFSCCLPFSSTLLFFIFSTVISGVHQYQTAIRLPRGSMRHRTTHSSHRTVLVNPMNSKCKKCGVCSHQCHKIVLKIKVTRFAQPGLLNNSDCICLKACERK